LTAPKAGPIETAVRPLICLTATLFTAVAALAVEPATPDLAKLQHMTARFVPVEIKVDVAQLPANERIIGAARSPARGTPCEDSASRDARADPRSGTRERFVGVASPITKTSRFPLPPAAASHRLVSTGKI
jgi:hypothetical protein